jgi:hypothetical protein
VQGASGFELVATPTAVRGWPANQTRREATSVLIEREHVFVMSWSLNAFRAAVDLMEVGRSDRQIEALTGIPRGTVGAWRNGRGVARHRRVARAGPAWRPEDPAVYAYLLGVYLGDGHIVISSERSARLVVTLDATYPAIVEEAREAMRTTFPLSSVTLHDRKGGSCVALQVCDPGIPFAFPQHGPGRKHQGSIRLLDWQRHITRLHPERLLRGLIHSDGCRTLNRFQTKLPSGRIAEYEYPRYFFSNLSADIRGIFCAHCELLGIRWTQSNSRNISVSHRDSVKRMDSFVGPKR